METRCCTPQWINFIEGNKTKRINCIDEYSVSRNMVSEIGKSKIWCQTIERSNVTHLMKKTKSFSDLIIPLRNSWSLFLGEVVQQQTCLLIHDLEFLSCSISSSSSSRRFSSASSQAFTDSVSVSSWRLLLLDLITFSSKWFHSDMATRRCLDVSWQDECWRVDLRRGNWRGNVFPIDMLGLVMRTHRPEGSVLCCCCTELSCTVPLHEWLLLPPLGSSSIDSAGQWLSSSWGTASRLLPQLLPVSSTCCPLTCGSY